jgi:t-SNARE complex subunit (syntaxin)
MGSTLLMMTTSEEKCNFLWLNSTLSALLLSTFSLSNNNGPESIETDFLIYLTVFEHLCRICSCSFESFVFLFNMNDRLSELRLAAGTMSSVNDRDAAFSHAIQQQVNEHINRYSAIHQSITEIDTNKQRIMQLAGRARTIASPQQRREVLANVDAVIDNTTQHATAIKSTFDELKVENDMYRNNQAINGGVNMQYRTNLYNQHAHKFQESMQQFNAIVTQFRADLQKRTIRELQIANHNLSDQQLQQIVDSGQADTVINAAMLDTSLQHATREIQERQYEIQKLEQQMYNLLQLYKDLQFVVELQQENLDRIDVNVSNARNYVSTAETDLGTASGYLNSVRKRKCCIALIVIAVLAIIIGVAAAYGTKK